MSEPVRAPTTQQILPRGPYLGVAASVSGSAVGWLLAQVFTDLRGPITSYAALDVVVLGLSGAAIGGFFLGFAAVRRGERALVEAAAGAAVGMLAAVLAGLVGVSAGEALRFGGSRQAFLIGRLVVWGSFGGAVGAALGARSFAIDRRRPIDGLVFGLLGGLVAALILSLPGPTQIWQLLAFLVVGLAIGFGASRISRAVGVVSTAPAGGRPGELLRHREWELYEGQNLDLDGGVAVRAGAGRVTVQSAGPAKATLGGRPVSDPVELGERQVFTVGADRYQFSRLPKVGR